ncbi:hypothetical protein D3C80_1369770 [compost metagenome]
MLEQNAEHLGVVGADQELVGVLLRVVEFGGERGAGHHDGAVAVEFGVDGLGEAGGVAVVQVDLVLAGELLVGRDRDVDLVARVFGHVAQLAALDAARVVDHLHVVANGQVDAHAGEGKHAGHGDGAADDDVVAAGLGVRGQRGCEAGAGCEQQRAAALGSQVLLHALFLVVVTSSRPAALPLNCGKATGGKSGECAATLLRAHAARTPENR